MCIHGGLNDIVCALVLTNILLQYYFSVQTFSDALPLPLTGCAYSSKSLVGVQETVV